MAGDLVSGLALLGAVIAWNLSVRGRSLDLRPRVRLGLVVGTAGLAAAGFVCGPALARVIGSAAGAICLPLLASAAFHVAERRRPPFSVEVLGLVAKDGTPIAAYRCHGGKRDALVIAHSLGGSSHRASLLWLADRIRLLADPILLDLRGHGASGGSVDGREWMDVAAAAGRLADYGYERIHLLGLSIGATAVLGYAAEGGRPASVTLISPPGTRRRLERLIGLYLTWPVRLTTRLQGGVVGDPRRASSADLRPCEETVTSLAECPLLVLGCERDVLFDGTEAHAVYAAAKPPKRLILFRGARHGPYLLDAHLAEVIRELRGILRRGGAVAEGSR